MEWKKEKGEGDSIKGCEGERGEEGRGREGIGEGAVLLDS